jgi:type III secretion system YscI/HrpB-like protein
MDITQVSQRVTEKMTEQATKVAAEPSSSSVGKFEAAYNQSSSQAEASAAANVAASPNPASGQIQQMKASEASIRPTETSGAETAGPKPSDEFQPGDRVLECMRNMSQNFSETMQSISSRLSAAGDSGVSVQDMLRIQMELSKVTLQQDLTTKVADKASNAIQTLHRNQ